MTQLQVDLYGFWGSELLGRTRILTSLRIRGFVVV